VPGEDKMYSTPSVRNASTIALPPSNCHGWSPNGFLVVCIILRLNAQDRWRAAVIIFF
jgi:hypothetical protein